MHLYKISDSGKILRNKVDTGSSEGQILNFLRDNRGGTDEQLAAIVPGGEYIVRKMVTQGYVVELSTSPGV